MAKKIKTSRALAVLAAKVADAKLGENILILNLQKIESAPADYFVLISCQNEVHVKAVAETVEVECKHAGAEKLKSEGWDNCNWVIIDMFDVAAHIMTKTSRDYYNLEKLWGDAQFLYLLDGKAKVLPKSEVKKFLANQVISNTELDEEEFENYAEEE